MKKGTFPFQAGLDGVLHGDCMRISEHEGTLCFKTDVGVNPETSTVQDAARQEFAKLPISRQQQWTASIKQNKQFDVSG